MGGMNEDLTLADLVGLDDTLRKIQPSWLNEPPIIMPMAARENGRAKHIATVLSKITYKRCKIQWLIAGIKEALSEPWFGITARTTVMDAEPGGGFIELLMEDVEIPPDANDREIVRRAFWVLERFEQHETQEQFWYDDDKVYDPHHKFLPTFDPDQSGL
jgi:hypothetical protein